MTETAVLGLFQGYGVEIESMIVDSATLSVSPIADQVLRTREGEIQSEIENGCFCWSNELVSHVIEMKTNGPARSLGGLSSGFRAQVSDINGRLAPLGARLMPAAMHPWMDPVRETRVWPHENSEIYDAYHRIFGCRGHGWSNLQSVHLNLPFQNDEEFARLHAAIRLVLPILPALAASSPILEGAATGLLDNRLEVYRRNQDRIPSVAGRVIPEPAYTRQVYEDLILNPMYRDIAPLDPEGILAEEWLNSRGAIARFERNTIEIRVIDTQECPEADLAILEILVAVLKALGEERWTSLAVQKEFSVEALEPIFLATVRKADEAVVADADYLQVFGLAGRKTCMAGEVWRYLVSTLGGGIEPASAAILDSILTEGCLARRILNAWEPSHSPDGLKLIYGGLCDCLAAGRLFLTDTLQAAQTHGG